VNPLSSKREFNVIKRKTALRDWILIELQKLEKKHGMATRDFIKEWKSRAILEPKDHILLEEFLEWDALAESFEKIEKELEDLKKHIKEG